MNTFTVSMIPEIESSLFVSVVGVAPRNRLAGVVTAPCGVILSESPPAVGPFHQIGELSSPAFAASKVARAISASASLFQPPKMSSRIAGCSFWSRSVTSR